MQMNQEEFDGITKSIRNDEVAEIVFGALVKIHMKLEEVAGEMTAADEWKYGLFKIFFKNYNTILTLSKGTNYVFTPERKYIDVRSINVQIRTCHELYLLFQYITTNTIGNGDLDEKDFKYECYRLSGVLDSKRTYERIKDFSGYREIYDREIVNIKSEITECKEFIVKSPVYKLLNKDIKDAVKNGYWRVDAEKKLSWNDLLAYTKIPHEYGILQYHVLSLYAHTSHASLKLEAQHDYNMISALAYLYKLSAFICCSTLNAFELNSNFLERREVALIIELMEMGDDVMPSKK
ncbi:hypothetical protein CLU90_3305 [Janthinobacterium sp. 67]|uniref:DUF5677 domain-containing protein n=1 Tax=Janthinobacterium sp. 67 TaxID=2035207 RepID=UPI000CCAADE3|nr:DUF5677 domain-containing protein [Janthinobacterium sp. 67]PJJ20073.1 hypothetical protein CLU90_3305 [Janthinobacterium sp. 67]